MRGWKIRFRVDPDNLGSPSLEFYAVHRMMSDRSSVRYQAGLLPSYPQEFRGGGQTLMCLWGCVLGELL